MYEYRLTQENSIFYCGKDLPRFLEARKDAGLLNITQKYKEENKSALEALSTPTVDAPEFDLSVTDDSKPVKKAVKKTTN
jgi:hypothetical protein